MFIDGYLALCSAVGAGAATEITAPGYARQPISFTDAVDGVALSVNPFGFGQAIQVNPAGRAIYDAPTGGNLLLAMPYPVPRQARTPWDAGDDCYLRLVFTALQPFHRGASFTGRFAAGAVLGTCNDRDDNINTQDLSQSPGNPRLLAHLAQLTAGVALSISRGVLQAASAVPGGTE